MTEEKETNKFYLIFTFSVNDHDFSYCKGQSNYNEKSLTTSGRSKDSKWALLALNWFRFIHHTEGLFPWGCGTTFGNLGENQEKGG